MVDVVPIVEQWKAKQTLQMENEAILRAGLATINRHLGAAAEDTSRDHSEKKKRQMEAKAEQADQRQANEAARVALDRQFDQWHANEAADVVRVAML